MYLSHHVFDQCEPAATLRLQRALATATAAAAAAATADCISSC
jgi:hypothetical protein